MFDICYLYGCVIVFTVYRQVKKPVDAAYHVSDRGFWQNDGDFSYSEAKYQAEFVALEVTQAEFNTLMEDFQSDIDVMGTAAIELPFVYNLLTVMHMGLFKSAPGSTDVSQFFAFTALPSSVYNRKNAAASIGSSVGICSLTPRASFAPVNSFFTVTWGFTQFNSTCGNVANPMAALEYTARDGESLEVSFDLITLSSAVAANYGILTALDLETVSKMYFPVYKKLQLLRKYDPFFTGMTTMYCLSLSTSDEFVNVTTSFEHTYNLITTRILEGEEGACFYVISDTLAVPTVNHNTLACSSCNASRSNAVCNDFDILIGLVYFPHSNNEPVNGLKGVFDALELYYSFNSQLNFSDSAYDAVHGIGTGGSFVSSWFDFCGDACVVLAANVWDNDHSITPYFYQYENAHCQDGLSSTSFSALGMNPPMVLVEVYWKCVSSAWDAFIQSVGIASGNTNTFSPWLIFFIIGPAITLYFNSVSYGAVHSSLCGFILHCPVGVRISHIFMTLYMFRSMEIHLRLSTMHCYWKKRKESL